MSCARFTTLCLLLLAAVANGADESRLRDAGSLGGIRLANSEEAGIRKVYIVQLKAPPAAAFDASLRPLANKLGVAHTRFDKTNPMIQEYAAQLALQQDSILARAGAGAELVYRYQYGLNGFAASMHPSQAHKIQNLPDVLQVWEDEVRPLTTNQSLEFLGLFDDEKGLRGKPGLSGDGIIIGVIDSGIAPEHPAV
ncbi:MAG: S8 family serine peptidase [Proteobacteria bacterium]|nr:S8 family serine peptidase [Pseudomonadota bacterium]